MEGQGTTGLGLLYLHNQRMRFVTWLKQRAVLLSITTVALSFAVGHLVWPAAKIDVITLGFLAFAVLPWLRGILKGVKLPGGLEITLADAEKAAEKINEDSRLIQVSASAEEPLQAKQVSEITSSSDPNLALVALRIEIERRLRALAAKNGLGTGERSLSRLVTQLERQGVLRSATAEGILTMVRYGNEAAHGAKVDPDVALWVPVEGKRVLDILDYVLSGSV